jgi:hypothetical protein
MVAARPFFEREARLGAVKRLDLRLFVNAQHDRPIRRVELKPNDINDLLPEHRIDRNFEPLGDMRPNTNRRSR